MTLDVAWALLGASAATGLIAAVYFVLVTLYERFR